MKERGLTCLLNTIIFLYMWAIFSDLFSRENYRINSYIVDDIATLIVIWLVPLIAFVILFRDPRIRKKLLNHRKELIAVAMIFLAGISQRLISVTYGLRIPVGMGSLFMDGPSTARFVFAVLQAITLAVKSIGLALALQFGLKQVGLKNLQIRSWSSILVLVAFVGFVALLIRDINALLPYFG